MRKVSLYEIEDTIKKNREQANNIVRNNLSSTRRKKSRTRSKGETIALNEIAVSRWKKAVETKKIKRLGERSLYYDYN